MIYRVYVCETYVIDGINKYSQDQSTVGYQGVVISQGGPMMWSVNCTVAATQGFKQGKVSIAETRAQWVITGLLEVKENIWVGV